MSETDLPDQAGQSVGARLAAARLARNLSVADVAQRLKLTPRQIEALEHDGFDQLGPVFSRGFVRNYARLLQLDPQPLLDAMQVPAAAGSEPIAVHDEHIALTGSLSRHWLAISVSALLIVIGLPLLVYQWLGGGSPAPVQPPVIATAPVALPAPAALPAAPGTPPAATAQAVASPEPGPVVPAATAAAPPPNGQASSGHLQLRFEQDSWVEITDARKKPVTSRLYRAGEMADLFAQPPLSLVVGNADHVRLIYNGQPINLTPRAGSSVARLILE